MDNVNKPGAITRLIIISVPPEPLFSRLSELMMKAGEIGKTKTALKFPPHITMRTGALVPSHKLEEYAVRFRDHCKKARPFAVSTDGIHLFQYIKNGEKKNLVCYAVKKDEQLAVFHKYLLEYTPYIKSKQTQYIPHLSLAYDDLDDENAERVMDYLLEESGSLYKALSWKIESVCLYRQMEQNGRSRWIKFSEASLGVQAVSSNPKQFP